MKTMDGDHHDTHTGHRLRYAVAVILGITGMLLLSLTGG